MSLLIDEVENSRALAKNNFMTTVMKTLTLSPDLAEFRGEIIAIKLGADGEDV